MYFVFKIYFDVRFVTNYMSEFSLVNIQPSLPLRRTVYQQCFVKLNLTNNFHYLYGKFSFFGIVCCFTMLLISIKSARKMRYVNFNSNLNMLPKPPESSADCLPDLNTLSFFTLYFFIFLYSLAYYFYTAGRTL